MSLIANHGGLLWNFLRGIALASAEEHRLSARMCDEAGTACEPTDDFDVSRAPLSPAVLASGVFVAAAFEEDAERWDGLA